MLSVAESTTTSASKRGCTSKLPCAYRTTPVTFSSTVPTIVVPPISVLICSSVLSMLSSSSVAPLPSSILICPYVSGSDSTSTSDTVTRRPS